MAKTRKILNRIQSIKSTRQITQAMKLVSFAKLSRLKNQQDRTLPYVNAHIDLWNQISSLKSTNSSISNDSIPKLLIPITTNQGLCATLNQVVCKHTLKYYQQQKVEPLIIPIGRKGLEFFQRNNISCNSKYVSLGKQEPRKTLHEFASFCYREFLQKKYSRIEVIYQSKKLGSAETVKREQLLPLTFSYNNNRGKNKEDYTIYEPNKEELFTYLLPKIVSLKLYKLWLEALISEHGTRIILTSKATDNADRLLKELKIAYNKTRQAIVTAELSEIIAGTEINN